MKRNWRHWGALLLAAVLCAGTAGCGSEQSAYLSQDEQEKIEAGIFDSLRFTKQENVYQVSFSNESKYTLANLNFYETATDSYVFGIALLPSETEVSAVDVYNYEKIEAYADNELYMQYVIGNYFYSSALTSPIELSEEGKNAGQEEVFSFQVETANGLIALDDANPVEFINGTEIGGMERTQIYSIASKTRYFTNDIYDLTLTISGKTTDRWGSTVVCKLFDENDIIVDTHVSFFFNAGSNEELSVFFYGLPKGSYRLVIEESN